MGEIKEKRRAKYIVKFLSKIWKFMRSVVNLISPLKISQCPNELFGKTEMSNAIFCTWFDGQRKPKSLDPIVPLQGKCTRHPWESPKIFLFD